MSTYRVDRRGDGAHAVSGELTFDTVPAVWQETHDWFADGTSAAVDLADVSRADSAGLALLLEWRRRAAQHGARVAFEHVPAQIVAIARLTGLESVLDIAAAAA